jgi:hypothetical protein
MSRTTRARTPIGLLVLLAATCALAPPAAAQDAGPPAPFRFASLEEGLEAARREGAPLLVLVTAPGWCEPCDRLDSRLRTERSMQRAIPDRFVAVHLTDRNPEHAALDFPGYPSFVVLHPSGHPLGAFRAPESAGALRGALRPYERPLPELLAEADDADAGAPDGAADTPPTAGDARATYRYPGGAFLRLAEDTWARETGDGRTPYSAYREDDRYVYLQAEEGTQFFAIPKDGGRAFEWDASVESWESTWQVSGPE